MEQFIKDQIKYGLKYLPKSLAKYPFTEKNTPETENFRKTNFIRGVCHPTDNYEQIKGANIQWVRYDMPFPVDENGKITEDFQNFKKRALKFKENGIKLMTNTPYPHAYFSRGIDINTAEGQKKVREIAKIIINELQGVAAGVQITNEMGIPHFTLPLKSMDEAVRFVGIQLEEMYPLKKDIIVGYNSAGPQADLHSKMAPYYKYCDYIGIDIYIGCFMIPGFMWMFDALLDYLWVMTKKPITVQEFGYIGGGKPLSKKGKTELLKNYGVCSEKNAKANIERFVNNLSPHMQRHIKNVCQNDVTRYYNLLFKSDFKDHLYKQIPAWVKIPGYEHTSEGQGKFYKDILPRLCNKPYVAGMFIYCYADDIKCHLCGQSDCPTETKWGLTTLDGKEKPAYYAVRDAFGKIVLKK